ncbi:MalY/PatB family protein [Romboutsia lituseburensis]|uniref:MalY/PatB family protein n=1 Tax=Romboutsia lituseburensis TaxID=1537 RepID=UPI00215A19BB|nr:pyridoxal phosphate-dependent aminotransferase [Romboutsia lituseburensis]MCR8746266.1 pyridoxal phosphate-dependent aminotransferase [Romboutsia lituseburensis]
MKYNFDKIVNRINNNSAKWNEMEKNFGKKDLIPMWIADMDFETAPEILEEMKNKLAQKIFGYVSRPDSYYQSAIDWSKKRYNYDIEPTSIIHSPGVIPTISILLKNFAKNTDKIMIQTPVYPPFAGTVKNSNKTLIENKLIQDDNGNWKIDFEDFEDKAKDENLKWFILCNPHNPVGRVWKKEELQKIADICLKYDVRVIADEIWRDLVYRGHEFTAFASLSKEVENITITCFSATKTFNLAGLQASFAVFPRKDELDLFDSKLGALDIKRNNPFSLVAMEAAFNKGEEWLDELVEYLEGNVDFVIDYVKKNIPKVKIIKPEGTYLVWFDFRELNLSNQEISKALIEEGKVALNNGTSFGDVDSKFFRMNIACPRYMVQDAIERVDKAVKLLEKDPALI